MSSRAEKTKSTSMFGFGKKKNDKKKKKKLTTEEAEEAVRRESNLGIYEYSVPQRCP